MATHTTLISMVGVFAVAAGAVIARSREIAVRKALGAPEASLVRGFVADGTRIGLLGVVSGAVAAYFASALLAPFLFGIPPDDPLTYLLVSSMLVVICALAAYLPTRRILGIEPREVLASD